MEAYNDILARVSPNTSYYNDILARVSPNTSYYLQRDRTKAQVQGVNFTMILQREDIKNVWLVLSKDE